MKSIKQTLTIILTLVMFSQLSGGRKAVFIHGFDSNSQVILDKNTPQELVSQGVIDEYVMFNYDLRDKQYENLPPDEVINKIGMNLALTVLGNNRTGDKWVLIGHSLGGLIARGVEPTLKNMVDLRGVLTVGAPHQGAPAAEVDENRAQAIVDEWHTDVSAGPDAGSAFWVTSALESFVSMGYFPDHYSAVLSITNYLDAAKDTAHKWIGRAKAVKADQLLGPGDPLIVQLNGTNTEEPYRSIIGAERSPTIMRWGSEFKDFFVSSGPMKENEMIGLYEAIKQWYLFNVQEYQALVDYDIWCKWFRMCDATEAAKAKRDKWQQGLEAWEDLDETWGKAIGSFVTETRTGYHWVVDCKYVERGGDCQWVYQGYTYTVLVPTKNDGLLPPEYVRWTADAVLGDEENRYYTDAEWNGGWNHSEMVRYTRIYPGENDGLAGDRILTPLKRNEVWLRTLLEN